MNETKMIEIESTGEYDRQKNQFHPPVDKKAHELAVEVGRDRRLWSSVCSWTSGSIIIRKLLALDKASSVRRDSSLHRPLDDIGWVFTLDENQVDPVFGIHYVSLAYFNTNSNNKKR